MMVLDDGYGFQIMATISPLKQKTALNLKFRRECEVARR
jgi:hypothetical protein